MKCLQKRIKNSGTKHQLARHTGYGGGILITEENTKLTLKNSKITGCLAQKDGGGIFANNVDNVQITLDNSYVDNNYANSDG